jgi:predicted GIY-YIG superfamily endonuclease
MLASFDRPETAKHLYFNLNNSLHLADPMFSPTYKVAGLYAIYKNDICYYVGQSKNVPSRLSTHLTGKYESCDLVKVYFIDEHGFHSFYEKNKDDQRVILENNEKYLIRKLKPIENIMVDSDQSVPEKKIFSNFIEDEENEREPSSSVNIHINKHSLNVSDDDMFCIESLDSRLIDKYNYLQAALDDDYREYLEKCSK